MVVTFGVYNFILGRKSFGVWAGAGREEHALKMEILFRKSLHFPGGTAILKLSRTLLREPARFVR